jgi:hypothetical protein
LREPVERFLKDMQDTPVARWHQFKELAAATKERHRQRGRVTAARSLEGLGLLELPPAGYLEVDETQDGLPKVLQEFFGARVDLRLCPVRADQVAGAVSDAQHRDRIPLAGDGDRPEVDVLVPVLAADKAELYADSYGWVAFVRRPADCGEPETEPPDKEPDVVTVYAAWSLEERPEQAYADGKIGEADDIGKVAYPAGGWQYPGGDVASKAAAWVPTAGHPIAVIALASTKERTPLAALRASLFVASMDTGIGAPPVHAFVSASGEEAIVLVFRIQIG